ncbi:MAG TPA: hypothetical protein VKU39_10355 [Streptosporangiaceae bacterium]|nr:hypothetical protein [Streptosporangiaceae bacterium]
MTEPVVVATQTVMSGLVVRWYRNIADAETHAELISASRDGVLISGDVYLHDLPDEWIADAKRAHEALKADRREEARGLATHRHTKVFGGDLEKISHG